MTAEPAACLASRPVSSVRGRPANWVSIRCTVTTFSLSVISGFFAAWTTHQRRGGVPMSDQDAPCGATELVPETELLDERPVRLEVAALEIGQQPAAGANHLEQATTPVVILGVSAEVVGEGVDPLGEQRHLHLGGPGVTRVRLVLGRHRLLVEAHAALVLYALAS